MIGIIDYGLGNLFSISNALKSIGLCNKIITFREEFSDCDKFILPGVGSFPEGVRLLKEKNLFQAIQSNKKPLLGICLGMQLLFEEGQEFKSSEGLGLIPGKIVAIENSSEKRIKIPHMGWNKLEVIINNPLTKDISLPYVYFVHSYKAITSDEFIIASSDYSQKIVAIVHRDNVYGTQFHPEKSGDTGIKILENFSKI